MSTTFGAVSPRSIAVSSRSISISPRAVTTSRTGHVALGEETPGETVGERQLLGRVRPAHGHRLLRGRAPPSGLLGKQALQFVEADRHVDGSRELGLEDLVLARPARRYVDDGRILSGGGLDEPRLCDVGRNDGHEGARQLRDGIARPKTRRPGTSSEDGESRRARALAPARRRQRRAPRPRPSSRRSRIRLLKRDLDLGGGHREERSEVLARQNRDHASVAREQRTHPLQVVPGHVALVAALHNTDAALHAARLDDLRAPVDDPNGLRRAVAHATPARTAAAQRRGRSGTRPAHSARSPPGFRCHQPNSVNPPAPILRARRARRAGPAARVA